ncbi:hypothetical protein LTR37_018559 [Vermiconidia calcicola]|uniref:Uncharacterized protein n=1 Tax=Vermiconidia calcicola TaxID=1690605 RepID=A0ACC3MGL9_9PEZI|nr:hypothetical protein LTR37_018559 [Vermiconidia calcicola]
MVDGRYEMLDLHGTDGHADADATEPLMRGEPAPGQQQHGQHSEPISLRNAGKVIWLLTLSAGISGLLFGYDTGVISSTLVSIGSDLSNRPLTTTDKSLITAITSFFALINKYGRRFVILVANISFIAGAVIQALSTTVSIMVVGRAAVGAAVGLASCATPLYITELAPAELRGRLVTIQSLFITGGQVVAYLIGWTLAHLPAGWKWMVGLGAAPALLQLCLLGLMFETPRWLVQAGRQERARAVLRNVYGGVDEQQREAEVEHVLTSIHAEIAEEAKVDNVIGSGVGPDAQPAVPSTLSHLLCIPGNRRALSIACMLQATQQLCGFNSLMYFSATIFSLVGFDSPIGTSLSIAMTNFIFTVAAFAFIDRVGRRRILLYSIPFMVAGLGICSLAFYHINDLPRFDFSVYDRDSSAKWAGWILMSMILYVASYAIGLGCVPWQQSELFPLRVRSLGSGIATATNWSSNFLIGITFLPMMELLSPGVTFETYALICVVGWMGVWSIYPETAGLELEEVGKLLDKGWGVKTSVARFQEAKANATARQAETGQSSVFVILAQRLCLR